MADPTPGPSKSAKNVGAFLLQTAPQKLRILRRVAAKLKEEMSGAVPKRAKRFELTGLQPSLVHKIVYEGVEQIELKVREVDRSVIYKQLIDYYQFEKKMPSTYQLFTKLNGKIPAHMDLGEFRKYLFKHGFMWKQILKGTCVVIENPKVVFERHAYLKNIRRYRLGRKTIFFIDEVAFDMKGDILTMKQSISRKNDPQIRLIYATTQQGVQFKQYVNDFGQEDILKWVKETLLKSLSEPSVIVLNNFKHHNEELLLLPNEDSLKKEMCQWLEYFDVPHDPDLPKSLLFNLVQRYTDISKKMYVIDNMLRQHDHEVLRLPDCLIKLTPATYYFDMLRASMPDLLKKFNGVNPEVLKTSINVIIDNLNGDNPREYSDIIVDEELNILLQDEAVDKLMDELEDTTKAVSCENNAMDSDLVSDDSDSNLD